MLYKLLRKFCTTTTTLSVRSTKPRRDAFLHLSKQQLLDLACDAQLSINQLILVNSALAANFSHYDPKLFQFINKHIWETHEPYFSTWLRAQPRVPNQWLDFYCNSFVNRNTEVQEELEMADLVQEKLAKVRSGCIVEQGYQQTWRDVNRKNLAKLHMMFRMRCMSFSQFVEYLRLANSQETVLSDEQIVEYVNKYWEPLSTEHTILLLTLMQGQPTHLKQGPLSSVRLELLETQNPKALCMLADLMASRKQFRALSQVLNKIVWSKGPNSNSSWSFDYLVWISTHLNPISYHITSPQIQKQIHKALLCTTLTNPSSLFLYLRVVPPDFLPSINNWLCEQADHIFRTFTPSSIVDMVGDLEDDHSTSERQFHEFISFVIEESLGKYKWEHTCQLYYYAKKWGIKTEHIEGLRVYLVSGYSSFGVYRRDIPLSSYYYKILEIVSPDELWRQDLDL